MLAAQVQATCLVVSAKTSAEVVSQAARKLGDAGSTPIGFVFQSCLSGSRLQTMVTGILGRFGLARAPEFVRNLPNRRCS